MTMLPRRTRGIRPAEYLVGMGDVEPRVPERRVETELLLGRINAAAGCDLRLTGVAEHGESGGALYVEWPDGRRGVVTRSFSSLESMRRTADVLNEARMLGIPVPRHDLIVPLPDDVVAIVQERLAGEPAHLVDAAVLDQIVEASQAFSGLLKSRPDLPLQPLHLRSSGPGFMRHETLASHNERSRRLLARIRDIGRDGSHEAVGDDLVHPDYTFGNVLFTNGRITGIVDWNGGISRGDRWLALVGLRFEMSWSTLYPDGQHNVTPEAIARLDQHLDAGMDPDVLLKYWAHWTLSRLDWTISNFPQADVDLFLAVGESRLSS